MKEVKNNRRRGLPGIVWSESERGEEDAARGLTPERLDSIMQEANSGDPRRQARLCRDVLERDWNIAHALSTRVNAVLGCPWHLEAGDKSVRAEEAARALEHQFREAGGMDDEDIVGMDGLIEELMGGLLPGYALVEKCWKGGGDISGFSAIPQSAIMFRDGHPLIQVDGEPAGIPADRARYIWHRAVRRGNDPARGGLVRPLAWLFCFSHIGVKDLTAFVERHGMPFVVGKVDQAGVETERSAVKRLIRNFGPSGGGVFSRNVEVQLMESTSKGEVYFALLNYLDDAVTKVILGQTASSGDSSGLSKGDAQSKVRQDILEADCRRISSTVQRQVIPQWMEYNMPGVSAPRFVMEYEAPEDRAALAQTVATLAQAGFQADAEELSERFGMKLTLVPRQPQGLAGAMAMGAESTARPGSVSGTGKAAMEAFRNMLAGIDALEECDDPDEFGRRLEALCAETAQAEQDTSPLERVAAEAMYSGFVAGVKRADDRMASKAKARK